MSEEKINANKQKVDYWKILFKNEWSYVTGAVVIVVLATALVIVTGKSWGVTGILHLWGGKFLELIGVNADTWSIYNGALGKFNFWNSIPSITNVGIVLGALLSALLAASFKIKKIKSYKQVIAAILGGILMGVGARMAMGCNIGALFSGLSAFSLHGWVFFLFIFIGAMVGSSMLKKWFM
ncbi:MAG: YeeE/YedE family protein [Spirochaetes bacterium]|nr:YeeE/YedE family protein [Spirochaetota bacterium]MBN2771950.1 YeeE/YedE family protein [Spirochaetota bacterium]